MEVVVLIAGTAVVVVVVVVVLVVAVVVVVDVVDVKSMRLVSERNILGGVVFTSSTSVGGVVVWSLTNLTLFVGVDNFITVAVDVTAIIGDDLAPNVAPGGLVEAGLAVAAVGCELFFPNSAKVSPMWLNGGMFSVFRISIVATFRFFLTLYNEFWPSDDAATLLIWTISPLPGFESRTGVFFRRTASRVIEFGCFITTSIFALFGFALNKKRMIKF